MRQGTGSRRGRAPRSAGKRSFGHGPNRSIESSGPNVKLRGTAVQVYDKYLALARDATSSGDRIAAENYFQHAEHYFRLMNAAAAAGNGDGRRPRRGNGRDPDGAPDTTPTETETEAASPEAEAVGPDDTIN